MAQFEIELQETRSYYVWIEAGNEADAEEKAREMLLDGDFYDIEDTASTSETLSFEFTQVVQRASD